MFQDMKVGTRLALAFGVVLVLMVGVIAVGVSRMGLINESMRKVTEENNRQVRYAQEARAASYSVGQLVRSLIILTDEGSLKTEHAKLQSTIQDLQTELAGLGQMFATLAGTTQQEKDLFAKVTELLKPIPPLADQLSALAMGNKKAEASALLMTEFNPKNIAARDAIEELVSFEEKLNQDEAVAAERTYAQARSLMMMLGAVAVFLAIAAGMLVTRSLLKQLGGEPAYAADLLQAVADGNLNVDVRTKKGDDSSMLFAVRNMIDRLKQVIAGQQRLVEAANRGDFAERVELNGLAGFQKEMGEGLNQLAATTGSSIDDVVRTMRALSRRRPHQDHRSGLSGLVR